MFLLLVRQLATEGIKTITRIASSFTFDEWRKLCKNVY
nr:MAG TPA: Protein of unknown function (DUF3135) [Caudoviricetes sp.]